MEPGRGVPAGWPNVRVEARSTRECGAATSVGLAFDDDVARLTVDNDSPSTNGSASDALSRSGGGLGLRGISERVALLGGEVEAGPVPGGWRVRAIVPVPGAAPTVPAPVHDPLPS
jgi:signal transduction histidine kinase